MMRFVAPVPPSGLVAVEGLDPFEAADGQALPQQGSTAALPEPQPVQVLCLRRSSLLRLRAPLPWTAAAYIKAKLPATANADAKPPSRCRPTPVRAAREALRLVPLSGAAREARCLTLQLLMLKPQLQGVPGPSAVAKVGMSVSSEGVTPPQGEVRSADATWARRLEYLPFPLAILASASKTHP